MGYASRNLFPITRVKKLVFLHAGSRPVRAVILQHEDPSPPGHVIEWPDQHGVRHEVFRQYARGDEMNVWFVPPAR